MTQINTANMSIEAARARQFAGWSEGPVGVGQGTRLGLSFSQTSFFESLSSRILWPGAGMNPPWMDRTAGLMPPGQPTSPQRQGPLSGISMPPQPQWPPADQGPVSGISMPPQPKWPPADPGPVSGISMPPQPKKPPADPGPVSGISMPPQPKKPPADPGPVSGISMPPQPRKPRVGGISAPRMSLE